MKEKQVRNRNRHRVAIMVFLAVPVLLCVFRIIYDVHLYYHGGTLIVQNDSDLLYDYCLRIPKGYTPFSGPRPLLVSLYGAGEVGADAAEIKDIDYVAMTVKECGIDKSDFPFVLVSPVTPKHGWDPMRVKILVEELVESGNGRFRIDPSRLYLIGVSMGGFGTFKTAEEYPDLFAAIAPICGGGNVEKAPRLKTVPIWAFHGDADDVVDHKYSAEMIEAVQKAGNTDARLTTIPGGTHDIRVNAYGNPELYRWMLRHKK